MSYEEKIKKQPELTVKFNLMPKTILKPFKDHFIGYEEGLVRSDPNDFVMFPEYGRHAQELLRFTPRKDDAWVLTFPKCGTTWTCHLLWLVVNDCNIEAAKAPLAVRTPFLEMPYMIPQKHTDKFKNMMPTLASVSKLPSPRVIKSHLPFFLLHPQLLDTSKIVYVARNPKDVIVSFYYHHRLMKDQGFEGDMETFAQYFMDNEIICTPFFPHILDAWSKRNHPNLLFLFYEDMKKNLRGEIEKVAAFFNKSFTDQQLATMTEELRFDKFAENESVNNESMKKMGFMNTDGHFIRKGKTGDWKNHFSPELNDRIDKWVEKNLAGSDITFVTELEKQD